MIAIIEECYNLFKQQLEMKKIALTVEDSENIHFKTIHTDGNRLKQIIINLLSNA
jgi:signal transduction histidine kinase